MTIAFKRIPVSIDYFSIVSCTMEKLLKYFFMPKNNYETY